MVESIFPQQDVMKNYSLIIEKGALLAQINIPLLSTVPPLSSVQEEGLPNQGNIITNLHLFSL